MRTVIAQILSIEKKGDLFVTTILDADGNEATGVGNDYQVGEPIYVYFHDRYNKCKFSRRLQVDT